MNNKEWIEAMGIDYEEVMTRFAGQEELYIKFLNRFLEDPGFEDLSKAFCHNEYSKMERSAHTLKGTTANLGLKKLSEACHKMVYDIRQNQGNAVLTVDFEAVNALYQSIIANIKTSGR